MSPSETKCAKGCKLCIIAYIHISNFSTKKMVVTTDPNMHWRKEIAFDFIWFLLKERNQTQFELSSEIFKLFDAIKTAPPPLPPLSPSACSWRAKKYKTYMNHTFLDHESLDRYILLCIIYKWLGLHNHNLGSSFCYNLFDYSANQEFFFSLVSTFSFCINHRNFTKINLCQNRNFYYSHFISQNSSGDCVYSS